MRGGYRLSQQRRLSLAQQRQHLGRQTDGRCISSRRGQLRWRYFTRPTAESRQYEVLIDYKLGFHPQTFVLAPEIASLGAGQPSHVYSSTQDREFPSAACLCLYRPEKGEWNSTRSLADTIVPWADLWLFFFEHWMLTGDWEGGGEHPNPDDPEPRYRRRKAARAARSSYSG